MINEDEVFGQALDLPPGDARESFLRESCGDHPAALKRIRRLLAIDAAHPEFLARPLVISPLDAASDGESLQSGDWVGPYQLVSEVGKGGMSVVWRARQLEPVRREVALKILNTETRRRKPAVRWQTEIRSLAKMQHSGIATILDAGQTDDGQYYLAMELVEGLPLNEFCRQHALPLNSRLKLMISVCQAVEHAHQRGTVHRDLKPANLLTIWQDKEPRVKVIDFGIATLLDPDEESSAESQGGLIVGTPEYMSPEQAQFTTAPVDTRSDVYGAGVILYELICGRLPFDDMGFKSLPITEVFRIVREGPVPRLANRAPAAALKLSRIPIELDWIVMRAMAREPDDRYASMDRLAEDLANYLAGRPVQAGPKTWTYRWSKWIRHHRGSVAVAGLIFVSLLMATVVSARWAWFASMAEARALRLAGEAQAAHKLAEDRLELAEQQKAAALQARQVATRVKDYLTAMFRSVQPDWDGRDIKVATLLERAVQSIDADFLDDLLTRGELKIAFGEALAGLGMWRQAVELLERGEQDYQQAGAGPSRERLLGQALLSALYARLGEPARGLTLLDQVVEQIGGLPGESHRNALIASRYRAEILMRSGQMDEALAHIAELSRQYEVEFGPEDPETLALQSSFSSASLQAGRLEQAETSLLELISRLAGRFGEVHPKVATARSNLAACYIYQGRLDEGLGELNAAIAVMRKLLPDHHPLLVNSLNNLAAVYFMKKDFRAGLPVIEEVVRLNSENLGENHAETIMAESNWAVALVELDGLATHFAEVQACLDRMNAVFGAGEDRTLAFWRRIGNRAPRRADDQRLMPWVEEAYSNHLEKLGNGHPATIECSLDLADVMLRAGRIQEAERYAADAVSVSRSILDNGHPLTCRARGTLAAILARKGQIDEALDIITSVVEQQKVVLGPNHADTLVSLSNLSDWLIAKGKHERALSVLDDLLPRWREAHGAGGIDWLSLEMSRNLALIRLGRADEALDSATHVVKGSVGLEGPYPEQLMLIKYIWIELLFARSQFDDARTYADSCRDWAVATFGADSHPVKVLSYILAELYWEHGDHELARRTIAAAAALSASDLPEASGIDLDFHRHRAATRLGRD